MRGAVNSLLKRPNMWTRRTIGELLFERRYGVRTAGRVDLEELGVADDERVYYIASNWRTLRRALRRDDVGDQDVFIDLGSGMGRMVLEAARYPFRRVIGVELSRQLHEIAQRNVANTRLRLRCRNIDLVCCDVLEYEIPDDVTVVYMFNPFRGQIFAAIIERLIESVERRPRPVRLIYFNPEEERYLLDTGRFQLRQTLVRSRHTGPPTTAGSIHTYSMVGSSADVA